MTEGSKSLLVVAVEPELFARFPPLLWRTSFDVSTPSDPQLALKAIANTAYSLIITAYPLPDLRFQRFLDEVRGFGSPCRAAGLLAVTEPSRVDEASAFLGRGLNRVVSCEASDAELGATIAELLEVAWRVAVRLNVSIRTTLWRKRRSLLTQTVNVSRTGMLLRAEPGTFDKGDLFTFRFDLPNRGGTIAGKAEVVRVARIAGEGGHGIGVRFLSFSGDGERRLSAYLDGLVEPKHKLPLPQQPPGE